MRKVVSDLAGLAIGIALCSLLGMNAVSADESPFHVDKKLRYVLQAEEVPIMAAVSADRSTIALGLRKDGKRYVWADSLVINKDYERILYLNYSPTGKRLAFAGERHRGAYVVVDGQEFGPYNTILFDSVTFSPDAARFAFLVGETPSVGNEKFFAVVDGVPQQSYSTMKDVRPVFSRDSRHLVYFAKKGHKSVAVLDGKEGPKFENTGEGPNFSFDGSLMAYMGARDDSVYLVINDSIVHSCYDLMDISFSPTSNDLAYTVRSSAGAAATAYLKGQPVGTYGASRFPVFSPDGKRFAYWASDSLGQTAVVDSVAGDHYKFVSRVLFSGDSRHYYYQVVFDSAFTRQAFVVDGRVMPEMKGALKNPCIFFAPQGDRVAFVYDVDSTEDRVVIDGVERAGYRSVGRVVFSDDGQHVAYIAKPKTDSVNCLYEDGKEFHYDGTVGTNIAYSRDSKHVAYYVNRTNGRELYIDHVPIVRFGNTFPMDIAFDTEGRITFFGLDNDSLYQVVVSANSATGN